MAAQDTPLEESSRDWSLDVILILFEEKKCYKILFILPQILLVTGGHDYGNNYLDSTEVLRPGSGWQEITSARLPRQKRGLRVSTVHNRVLLFGE